MTVKNLWVDDSRFMGLTVQMTRLTVQMIGLTIQMRTSSAIQTSNRLSGSHYGA